MSQSIILWVAGLGGLACPAHMWWSHRRGRQAASCLAASKPDHLREIGLLRARQKRLSAMIAAHEAMLVANADAEQVPAERARR